MFLAGRQPDHAAGQRRRVLPAVFKAIDNAQQKVILETFIWFEDDVGKQLHSVLLRAARRGVKIEVLLDGYGSPDLSDAFVNELTAAGVVFRYYDPGPRLFGMRTNLFRRMHRKIVVVDETVAFVGGINYSAEHMSDYGPEAKQDYAIRIEGPVVQDILLFELENLPGKRPFAAGGDAAIARKRTASPAKRRRFSSGAITASTGTILNATI
jgi:cardiolipin synthase